MYYEILASFVVHVHLNKVVATAKGSERTQYIVEVKVLLLLRKK